MTDALPGGTELRQSEGALAVIARSGSDGPEWLVRWNKKWQCYAFVGGHRHEDESFRECLVREVAEELEITDIECTVGQEPLARLEFVDWSESAQADTAYIHELFAAWLNDDSVIEKLGRDGRLRWLTSEEIRSQHGRDGSPVSATLSRYLDCIAWRPPENEAA